MVTTENGAHVATNNMELSKITLHQVLVTSLDLLTITRLLLQTNEVTQHLVGFSSSGFEIVFPSKRNRFFSYKGYHYLFSWLGKPRKRFPSLYIRGLVGHGTPSSYLSPQ